MVSMCYYHLLPTDWDAPPKVLECRLLPKPRFFVVLHTSSFCVHFSGGLSFNLWQSLPSGNLTVCY